MSAADKFMLPARPYAKSVTRFSERVRSPAARFVKSEHL